MRKRVTTQRASDARRIHRVQVLLLLINRERKKVHMSQSQGNWGTWRLEGYVDRISRVILLTDLRCMADSKQRRPVFVVLADAYVFTPLYELASTA